MCAAGKAPRGTEVGWDRKAGEGCRLPAYAALYRSWRPRRLADVAGQEHVTRTLLNALRQGHPAHAYLFCGPRGTGKTSTARILAAALNCEHPQDGDACGSCESCQAVAQDRLIDVQEIDAASHRQVDDVRALRERVGYVPAAGRHKVYILDEVHMLTEASWNTLLKTLEEPPAHTTFILCTTDPRKVLPTVVSRCQRFDFRRLSQEEIATRLREVCGAEGISADADAVASVARRADGSLRDALAILDQLTAYVAPPGAITARDVAAVTGSADEDTVAALIQAAERGDAPGVFRGVERLYADGKDMAQVGRDLTAALRDRLVALPAGGRGATGLGPEAAWLLRAISVLSEADGHMRRWPQPRLVLEVALLQLMPGESAAVRPAGPSEPRAVSGRRAVPEAAPTASTASAPAAPRPAAPVPVATAPTAPDPVGPAPVAGPFWDRLLEELRAVDAPSAGHLTEAVPQDAGGGVLRVRFPSGMQAALAERARARVGEIAARLQGRPVRVEFTGPEASDVGPAPTRGSGSRDRAAAVPRRPPPAEPPRAGDPEEAFQRAVSLFDGTPVAWDPEA